ncbi:uncharacterized protein JCM15063_002030 [Sporobolomyces koalae]|uniref:uncharacterized protein n=1 Tax=Sporobolomyces koalae TaxID=500713 RepID=UPI00317240EE
MTTTTAILALFASTVATLSAYASPVTPQVTMVDGFYNPTSNGGRWLTLARNTYPAGLGEPINVVISANSDPLLLTDTGFFDWSFSVQFSGECLGQSDGAKQAANLGDGLGFINQTILLRENFGDTVVGTCKETFDGGYHYRVWKQNGSEADSGAWFLAASLEGDLASQHEIQPNGYDRGRDAVVERATIDGGTKSPLTNRTFITTVANQSGVGYYANVSTDEINHGVATDGIVAVLTVKITSNGSLPDQVIGPQGIVKGESLGASTTSSGASLNSVSLVGSMQVIALSVFSIFALALLL